MLALNEIYVEGVLIDTRELRLQTAVGVIERRVGDTTVVTFYDLRGRQVGAKLVVHEDKQSAPVAM